MAEFLVYTLADAVWDTLRLFPFLLVTYLVLEWLEVKATCKTLNLIQKSGRWGIPVGALCGLLPQCGLAAAAANFYAARIISVGTLIAVFLSTSDEMLPLLISNAVPVDKIVRILLIKFLAGIFWGVGIDFLAYKLLQRKLQIIDIETLCRNEKCQCECGSVIKSALVHCVKISLFVFVVTFFLNVLVATVGVSALYSWLSYPLIGPIVAGIVGLIPNCSASVIITQMYLENTITFGSMMSGVLVGAGVGLLVLYRVNPRIKENLFLTFVLYCAGVITGCLIDWLF